MSEPPSGCANVIDITNGEREGVTLYAPASNDAAPGSKSKSNSKPELIPKSVFARDAARPEPRGPEGHAMPSARRGEEERAGGVVIHGVYRGPPRRSHPWQQSLLRTRATTRP